MTVPLPSGDADELIWHMNHCFQCRLSKVFPSEQKCEKGQRLVSQVLNERNGKAEG
jgi:hypothetical protein